MAIEPGSFASSMHQAVLRNGEPQPRAGKPDEFQQAASSARSAGSGERMHGQSPDLIQGQHRTTPDERRSPPPSVPAYAYPAFDRDGAVKADVTREEVNAGQIVGEMQDGKSLFELAGETGLTVWELKAELEDAGYQVAVSFDNGALEFTIHDSAGNHVMTVQQTLVPNIFGLASGSWVVDVVTYVNSDGNLVTQTSYSNGDVDLLEKNTDFIESMVTLPFVNLEATEAVIKGVAEGKSLTEIADELDMTVEELRAEIDQEKIIVIESKEADGGMIYTISAQDGTFIAEYTTNHLLAPPGS
ncbi:hypothetical protein [Brucella cytisi]|uniref:Uncharacterized protein n=1 Tax=Brucella cytisi TaxID=407152 RepID=A0A1J6I432_9HYPH|nr:hypothetical protein [Brucella cytisi]OIS93650.1 hypothetical protein BLA27_10080 [Brucella cytisi]